MDESSSSPPPNHESSKQHHNALLQFISDMLMDEDDEDTMPSDCLALQATQQSLYDTLHNITSPSGSSTHNNYAAADDSEPAGLYDEVLLCDKQEEAPNTGGSSSTGSKKKKIISHKKIIDLRSLLLQCAQSVELFDNATLGALLWEIRQHASPKGDGLQRAAHYIANALDARLTCAGPDLYAALNSTRISTSSILKSYRMYYTACPFRHMSNILANTTIANLAARAPSLHIIDFGILHGFQWPCLIRALSLRPGGPPMLRITGIDFPPSADTCRRLAGCAERFGVPFEFKAIAKKWEKVTLGDVSWSSSSSSCCVVVNCMHRMHNVQDETETGESPRDAVLRLIGRIGPDVFVHGVANGSYSSPFFITRFKEALFHFCTVFDMFEETVREGDEEERLLYERQFFGKEAMNVIACDGGERVERPATYKNWQKRTARAGFRQVSFDREIVREAKAGYHKDFTMDVDGKWVLVGWKGRVVHGFSCWRPSSS